MTYALLQDSNKQALADALEKLKLGLGAVDGFDGIDLAKLRSLTTSLS